MTRIAVITIGRSGSSTLIDVLRNHKIDIIPKPFNHLYPDVLAKKFGLDVKVIFIVRNLVDVIYSVKQREQDKGMKWIKEHYKNLDASDNLKDHNQIHLKDTLKLEKLFDAYMTQKKFDVLFLRYEKLYLDHKTSIDALSHFIDKKIKIPKFNPKNKYSGSTKVNDRRDRLLNDIKKTYQPLNKKINQFEYKFHYKRSIKIAHVINPFKCPKDNPSYLYYAQPITFKSMKISKDNAESLGIKVDICTVNYPEDDSIIPDYFKRLPYLNRSTRDLYSGMTKKKLPFVQDLLDAVYKGSDADFLVLTNADIGVQKGFYTMIHDVIAKHNYDGFIVTRRDAIPKFINGKRLTENDLDLIYKQEGKWHYGFDCFIMSRNVYHKVKMGNMFVAYPPWGKTLMRQMEQKCKKFKIFRGMHQTFHLGADVVWHEEEKKAKAKPDIWKQNIKNSRELGVKL